MNQTNRNGSVITILETDMGPLISHSRASVYDVLDAANDGFTPTEISKTFNLSPHQVEVALDYIRLHHDHLQTELKRLLIKKAEREQYYRALEEEIKRQRPVAMTPERQKLNDRLARMRQSCEETSAELPAQLTRNGREMMSQTNRNGSVITILETDSGPMISHSRTSVYDVLDAANDGFTPTEISKTFNLSPHQVEVALDYIRLHHDHLQTELKRLLIKKAEREKYYRALEEEIRRQRPVPMTPERQRLTDLLAQRRQTYEGANADYTE